MFGWRSWRLWRYGGPSGSGLLLHLLFHLVLLRQRGGLTVRVVVSAGLGFGQASHLEAGGCL